MRKFKYGELAAYKSNAIINPIIKVGICFDSKVHRIKNKSRVSYFIEGGFQGREWLFEEEIGHLSIIRKVIYYFFKT